MFMGQKGKILITEEGSFDLATYRWDDHRFSDLLVKENPMDQDQAMDISRFIREEIGKIRAGQDIARQAEQVHFH
jgi:hypothetical protein